MGYPLTLGALADPPADGQRLDPGRTRCSSRAVSSALSSSSTKQCGDTESLIAAVTWSPSWSGAWMSPAGPAARGWRRGRPWASARSSNRLSQRRGSVSGPGRGRRRHVGSTPGRTGCGLFYFEMMGTVRKVGVLPEPYDSGDEGACRKSRHVYSLETGISTSASKGIADS